MLKFRPYAHPLPTRAKWLLLVGVALDLALVIWGATLFPQFLRASPTGTRSLFGAVAILFFYAVAGWVALPRLRGAVLRVGLWGGLVAGLIFAVGTAGEYVLRPADNRALGSWEFGLVFLVLLGTAIYIGRAGHPNHGVTAAVTAAMLASLLWLAVTLATFYLFFGTPAQRDVFQAEGTFEDFARWGLPDFQAFIMEDYLGAGFFHLLLLPLVATFLGAVGGWVGRMWGAFKA